MKSGVEAELQRALDKLGLANWRAVHDPDPTAKNRAEAFPESRTILIHDEDSDDAVDSVIHEAVEVKLRALIKPYRETTNALIQLIDRLTYETKERFIEDLIPLIKPGIACQDAPEWREDRPRERHEVKQD